MDINTSVLNLQTNIMMLGQIGLQRSILVHFTRMSARVSGGYHDGITEISPEYCADISTCVYFSSESPNQHQKIDAAGSAVTTNSGSVCN